MKRSRRKFLVIIGLAAAGTGAIYYINGGQPKILELANRTIEPLRRDKVLGSSLEADVEVELPAGFLYGLTSQDMSEYIIVSSAKSVGGEPGQQVAASATKTNNHKCGRCWRHLPEVVEDGDLCNRCEGVVNG